MNVHTSLLSIGGKSVKVGKKMAVKVADEVWIATALLHRENPGRSDFTNDEIVERARREAVVEELRPGVRVHAIQHCVANRPPDPGRYCMLIETGNSTRRLWRPGDPVHPKRMGAKSIPRKEEIPEEYHLLVDWYHRSKPQAKDAASSDPILGMRGLGKKIWKGVDPDDYVRELREGWNE
jgi:hypothetical protein